MKPQAPNQKYLVFVILSLLLIFAIKGTVYSQDLDVGEPRTVRMIYFLPNDRPYQADVVQKMKDEMRSLQTFFAEQMQAHGHGKKTFQYETDATGEPKVHRVDGQHSESYYITNNNEPRGELQQKFDMWRHNTIYLIVLDNRTGGISEHVGGIAGGEKYSGTAWIPSEFSFELAAHELGHAFGLQHDFRDGRYILSYGPGLNRLSACAAEYLAVDPYFNPDIPLEEGPAPTIELISPRTYPAGSESVTIRLKVSDVAGVHQVLLFSAGDLIACRGLNGKKETIVEFEYEGVNKRWGYIGLSDAISHRMYVEAVNTNGDVGEIDFNLAEISQHHIHRLEVHTNNVQSLAFSPDGKIIASGRFPITVEEVFDLGKVGTTKLWDVATRRNIATFKGGCVAFSPNGRMLATGALDNTVRLWDVSTQRNIATFEGHTDSVTSVAFSPDGTILASGSNDESIKLWEVETQRNIATLKGHRGEVRSVAFSPDGTILASGSSGSHDGAIKLWDVVTGTNIASFEKKEAFPHIRSVAFSPDGTILASGQLLGVSGTVKLWDVATKTYIVHFKHKLGVESVAFSPDGKILASASRDGVVVWDVTTGTRIADLPHTSGVSSVTFSPDGRTLASGMRDGAVALWDVGSVLSQEPVDDRDKITISEIMVASNDSSLPQWIELYNPSKTHTVNLKGWTLKIENHHAADFDGHRYIGFRFGKEQSIKPQETL